MNVFSAFSDTKIDIFLQKKQHQNIVNIIFLPGTQTGFQQEKGADLDNIYNKLYSTFNDIHTYGQGLFGNILKNLRLLTGLVLVK